MKNQKRSSPSVPVYQPLVGEAEKRNVSECMESGWISSRGKFVEEFESTFANFIGAEHGIGVCNGTVALHLALESLGIGHGDEVICPTLTYIASANAIRYTGAEVCFVDSESSSWNICPDAIEAAINHRTRAIVVVHLYGLPCNMAAISKIAKKHGLAVVEDCAEAVGASIDGQHVGTFGDIATYSFYGNKTITTGEGGMVTTRHEDLSIRCRKLRGQGLAEGREYWHDMLGFNYRMTNVAAAIGCGQMERLEQTLERKFEIDQRYRDRLSAEFDFQCVGDGVQHGCWMTSLLAKSNHDKDSVRSALKNQHVETRPVFFPLHSMPIYQSRFLLASGKEFSNATAISGRGLTLPSYPDLANTQIDHICDSILQAVDSQRHADRKAA
ncbi:MAG: DegT/DnrJ/EryC1/StrS family aminotransferase [Planctomycetota bacterium]